jgi:hypothetical protein
MAEFPSTIRISVIGPDGRRHLWISDGAGVRAGEGVTTFKGGFAGIVGVIEEHHPGWTELEVSGVAREELEKAFGAGAVTAVEGGFRVR